MNLILNKKMLMVVLSMLTCCCLLAQKRVKKSRNKDTLADMRTFIQLTNIYQQTPLFLELEWKNSTNYIMSPADTASINAVFYLKPGLAYVRLDDAEQMVSDSMALLVSDKLRRMILYSDARPVLNRMNMMASMIAGDSSLQRMSARYIAQPLITDEQIGTMKLSAREMVQGTALPKESLELQYNLRKKEPIQVTTIRRSMVRLSEEHYQSLAVDAAYKHLMLAPEGKGYYLVKEQKATFIYKQIKHEADMQLPVTIGDRLTRNERGELVPVKEYEQYAVTYN